MEKKKIIMAICLILAVVGIGIGIGSTYMKPAMATEQTAEEEPPIAEDDKIYMVDFVTGFALNDEEINSIINEAHEQNYNGTTLEVIATTGDTLEDPESGLTFVVRKGLTPSFRGSACIISYDNLTFSKLRKWDYTESDFENCGEIQTSFGPIHVYTH